LKEIHGRKIEGNSVYYLIEYVDFDRVQKKLWFAKDNIAEKWMSTLVKYDKTHILKK